MNDLSILHMGYLFSVSGDYLSIDKDGIGLAELRIAPVIEGKKTSLGAWRRIVSNHLTAQVEGIEAIMHIEVDHGYVCFYVETTMDHFKYFSYLTEGRINGDGWQTYLSDENDCFRSFNVDAEVPISSCFNGLTPDEADGEGMTDPGDIPPTWIWNVPIRTLSLHTECGWIGLSLPGPLPVGITRLAMNDRQFSICFEELRPACDEGNMPRVYFLTGLSGAYDALEGHRDLSMELGWMVHREAEQPLWWAKPVFKPALDLFSGEQGVRVLYRNEQGEWASHFTTENFRKWVRDFIRKERLKDGASVILDQVFMYGYSSRRIIRELDGAAGFRTLIDEFKAQDIRVGLYFHPYFVGVQEPFYSEHPECFCRPKDPSVSIQWCDTETLTPAYLDWTHPKGRQRQLDYLEFLLSDKPGCLNADWLAFNNAEGPDPRLYDFHNPNWAIGDLLQFKVHRLVYERAKKIKSDCLVRRITAGACYLQPYVDQIEMMEHWMSGTAEWYKRGQIITRATRDMLFGTDPYFVTQTKGHEYWMAMMVWNIPEYGGLDKVIHPYTYWRELPEKDRRRRTSGIQVYLNAPMNRTDICRVTWEHGRIKEVWRRRSVGILKGFYAALAISPRCFVTYSETCARIGSSESRHAWIPLPPGAEVAEVVQVLHKGGQRVLAYEQQDSKENLAVWIKIADCGFEILYSEIRYLLKKK